MQTHHKVRKFLRQVNVCSLVVKFGIAAVLGLLLTGAALGVGSKEVQARSFNTCPAGDQTYIVVGGDTLGRIALRYGTTWQALTRYNRLANPNLIYMRQTICIPGRGAAGSGTVGATPVSAPVVRPPVARPGSGSVPVGHSNVFPYATCTWWADQRYYQMHGVFVPWRTNANAWQWTARAYESGWRVSTMPSVGAIMDLQPGVQGAWSLGHVAVVERVLPNGHVIASSMSWYPYWWLVTDYTFVPGPGVTFINQ